MVRSSTMSFASSSSLNSSTDLKHLLFSLKVKKTIIFKNQMKLFFRFSGNNFCVCKNNIICNRHMMIHPTM